MSLLKDVKAPKESEVTSRSVYLPPLRFGILKTLILDLDETLVHCESIDKNEPNDESNPPNTDKNDDQSVENINKNYSIIVRKDRNNKKVKLYIRPFLKEFLSKVSKKFEVVVFTSSDSLYANMVVNEIDPDNKYIT